MMYLEYNWTAMVYQPRFGDTFISIGGYRSFDCKRDAVDVLATCGLKLGAKTDSRTWLIESAVPYPDDYDHNRDANLERPGGCGAARNPVGTGNHAADNAASWYADIKRLLARLEDVSLDEREEIEREIQDGPLSVFVRDGWRSPYATSAGAEEYEILLSTGGPALRVYGRLGEHGEPVSAALQHQDWGTPWTDWYPEGEGELSEVAGVLLAYARAFSFGE